MGKIRNAAFSCVVGAVLLCCIANVAADKILPGYEMPTRSYLEARVLQETPELELETLASRSFQDSAEQYVADGIPFRDEVLLTNAALQRQGIVTANIPYSYDAFHAFYGAKYLLSPQHAAAVELPSDQRVETPSVLNRSANAFSANIQAHPELRWQFALVDRSRISLANPAHNLVSKPADYLYYIDEFVSLLPESCTFVNLSFTDSEQYFQNYYHTDHHAQITGALDAYRQIIRNFDKDPVSTGDTFVGYAGPFYGSEARGGLTTDYSDLVLDVEADFEDVKVIVDGKERPITWLKSSLSEEGPSYDKPSKFANAYSGYFHADAGHIEINNPKGESNLLVIGDSFTNNIDYLFSQSYRTTHIVDPRHYKGTLEAFLSENDVDDVLILMANNTAIASSTRSFLSSEVTEEDPVNTDTAGLNE